jgi:hypothetical protein
MPSSEALEEYDHFPYQFEQYKERLGNNMDNLANLKSKARQCDIRLTCTNLTCQTELNYSEPVILGLFINGINNMELQQDLLAEQWASCGP